MSVPFVWVTGIFIHREIRLGWYLSWRLIEVLILILMATAMTLMPYVNVTFKLSTSAVLALTIAYCGVMLLSIGGRTAMVCYMKVEGRRFFRPLVPDKVSGFSDYIAVVFLSLVIFSYLVLKHSA